ncbi:CVNH domain-containing protein [Aspergillus fijiensis CBS 313.89]|uniref:Cyanovirin-N n=1 Tax=Aspergillus fijiensis CBS 313.89 TaxID=1448319 RepID=A0A8G1RWE5_9EURO|nr:Cyanovirin-N [Aspergillus fijiensis CBS 313.89]RAK78036.1 Cyanovirin-N [Aspergillus fijiensis CBS 313.89]
MQLTTALLVTAGLCTSVYGQGYADECIDIYLKESWLVGTCPTSNGTGTITSSVFLPNKITNTGGTLGWKIDGAYSQSCGECQLLAGGGSLDCLCEGPYGTINKNTTLNLEEHIANYDGHLLSNLTGSIISIPANSSWPVPSDFNLQLQTASSDNNCTTIGGYISLNDPQDCYYLNIGVQYYFYAAQTVNNQGWEIAAYHDSLCSGKPAGTFTPDNDDICLTFPDGVTGFSVTPLWNAD